MTALPDWMVLPSEGLTATRYNALPEDVRHRIEIVDGGILVRAAPRRAQQVIAHRLANVIAAVCGARFAVATDVDLLLRDVTLLNRRPDVVVFDSSLPRDAVVHPRHCLLVVEVMSPGSVTADQTDKPAEYAAAGIENFWRIEDDESMLTAFRYRLDPATTTTTHEGVDTVKRIGIIGVGEIGRAIVDGLYEGDDQQPEVFLSPRGARTAAELSERYQGVGVCADNQEVVDRSEVVIIAVRRQDRHEALAGLTVDGDRIVVNVMAGVGNDDLRQTLATDAPLVRAIPLPAIRERRSITVTYPSHPAVNAFFEQMGGVLPVADETAFNVFSALTGTLTTHYSYLATLTSWAAGQGVASDDADRYVRNLFQGVGRALSDETRSLHQLAADHETPNGNNERIRTTWFAPANSDALNQALDDLLADLK